MFKLRKKTSFNFKKDPGWTNGTTPEDRCEVDLVTKDKIVFKVKHIYCAFKKNYFWKGCRPITTHILILQSF